MAAQELGAEYAVGAKMDMASGRHDSQITEGTIVRRTRTQVTVELPNGKTVRMAAGRSFHATYSRGELAEVGAQFETLRWTGLLTDSELAQQRRAYRARQDKAEHMASRLLVLSRAVAVRYPDTEDVEALAAFLPEYLEYKAAQAK